MNDICLALMYYHTVMTDETVIRVLVLVGQGSADTWWGGQGPADYCSTSAAPCCIWTWACGSWCSGKLTVVAYHCVDFIISFGDLKLHVAGMHTFLVS